jgi:rhodanese-related sulfurtransferase
MDTVIPAISPAELRLSSLGPDAPLLIDVRRAEAFAADPAMLAGATWRDPFAVTEWEKFLPRHRPVVVYCVHGHEISKNTCAALRAAGVPARILAGGIEDARAAGLPTMRKAPGLNVPSAAMSPSRWITRERPRVDRIACPWLVRRFIDPLAEFIYVPASEVLAQAAERNAIPYDIPGVTFTHRGERCSFDALVEDFALKDAALARLAAIVRGADTDHLDLAPQSAGLVAISLGLAANFRDDLEMLERGMVVYDALYAWCRAAETGTAERHNWKPA